MTSTDLQVRKTKIPGCFELIPVISEDARGRFVKTYNFDVFERIGLCETFVEQYYSTSTKGVLRGMHFQAPPCEHSKMVYCTDGAVMDVVVDIRKGSPCFGQAVTIELTAEHANMVFMRPGLAHGFFVRSEQATLIYNVTTAYSQPHDKGIRWDSVPVRWPSESPIVSLRDREHPRLSEFSSPFDVGMVE